jgi:ATP-binding cassette, subfamily C, bacterial CydC
MKREDLTADRPSASHANGLCRLREMLGNYRGYFFWTIVAGVGMHACAIAIAGMGAWIVGLSLSGAAPGELVPWLWRLGFLVIPMAVLPWLETTLAHVFAFLVLADLRIRIYDAFERLAPGYLLEQRSGDLGTAAMGDVEVLELGLSHTFPPLLEAVIIALFATGVMACLHPLLALTLGPFLAAAFWAPVMLERYSQGAGRKVREYVGQAGAEVVDAIQGLREVLAFGAREIEMERLGRHERKLHQAQIAHGRVKGWQAGTDLLVAGLAIAAMVIAASWLVSDGRLSRAMLPVCVAMTAATFLPLHILMEAAREFPTVLSALDRVHSILTAEPSVRDRVETPPPGPIEPVIRFENVTFRYRPHLPAALREVSFEIAAGETVALVGHSGAGKSTCANLLMRLWDTSGGRITVGGHDIRDFPQEDLRALLAYVPQEVYLFNRPARENVLLGRKAASSRDARQAAEAARARAFIEDLPMGWDTPLGERGVLLSGGQRQRIAIARAALKNAPILVLDEAVSNLDVENEHAVREAMTGASHGKTTLIIAHRLSTIRNADRIIVLENGRVVESGTYRRLALAGGPFSRLVSSNPVGVIP